MMEPEVLEQIQRLESIIVWTRPKYWQAGDDEVSTSTKHRAIIDLVRLHCRHPGLDPASAQWAGRKFDALVEAFDSGRSETLVQLDRRDSRRAFSRNGRCQQTGLTWPTAILFHHDTTPRSDLRQGEDIFHRIAKSVPLSAGTIKSIYYECKNDPVHLKELADFYARFKIPKKRKSLGKN